MAGRDLLSEEPSKGRDLLSESSSPAELNLDKPKTKSFTDTTETAGGAAIKYPSVGYGRKKGELTGYVEGLSGQQEPSALTTGDYAKGIREGRKIGEPLGIGVDIVTTLAGGAGLAKGGYELAKPAVKSISSALGLPLKSAVKEFRATSAPEIFSNIEGRTQDIIKQEALRGKAQRGLATTSGEAVTEAEKQSENALYKIARPSNDSILGGDMRSFFEPNLIGIETLRSNQYQNMMKPVKDAAKAQEKSGKYWSNSQTGKAFLDDIDNNLQPQNKLNLTREEQSLLAQTKGRLSQIEAEGAPGGIAKVPFEGVDKEIRRLRDLASGPPKEGVDAITQQFAGKLANKLSDSVFGYVTETNQVIAGFAPGGRMAKSVYKDMSVPVNQYKSTLGQQLTARFQEAPEFFMSGESVLPNAAFRDRESARQLIAFSTGKTKKVEEFAAQHTANQLKGKTAEQAQQWFNNQGAFLEEFPTVKKFSQDYINTLAKNEAEIVSRTGVKTAAEKAAFDTRSRSISSQKDLADIKVDLERTIRESSPNDLRRNIETILPKLREYGVFNSEREALLLDQVNQISKISDKRTRDRYIVGAVAAVTASYPVQRAFNRVSSFSVEQQ